MTLCISGKQSVEELEKWTRKYFSSIPDRVKDSKDAAVPVVSVVGTSESSESPSLQWWGKVSPYLPQIAASLQEIVPISPALRSLTV